MYIGYVLELQSKDIGFDNKREKLDDVLNVLSQFIDCLMRTLNKAMPSLLGFHL